MKLFVNTRSRLTMSVLTLVLVIIPFGLTYMFYVQSQSAFYTRRDMRVLHNIGNNISGSIATLTEVLENTASKPRTLAEKDMTPQELLESRFDKVELSGALVKINRVECKDSVPVAKESTQPAQKTTAVAKPKVTAKPQVTTTIVEQYGAFGLNFRFKSAETSFCATADLNDLIEPLVGRYLADPTSANEDLFDDILIAEQGFEKSEKEKEPARVIFHKGQSGSRVVNLDDLKETVSGEKGAQADSRSLGDRSSTMVNVELAGGKFKLFIQPVPLTITSADTSKAARWLVCGLVSERRFTFEQTLRVSYTHFVVFAAVLAAALLSLPLLKLWLMGPKDRLVRSNVLYVVVSAVFGTALLGFVLLDGYTYLELEWRMDDQLKEFARQIKANVKAEFGQALPLMEALDNQAPIQSSALAATPNSSGSPSIKQQDSGLLRHQIDLLKTMPLPNPVERYQFFNTFQWIDSDGWQQFKLTTRPSVTRIVNVADRDYFKNARQGRLWRMTFNERQFEFAVERVHSRNTGEKITVISRPSQRGKGWVNAMDTRLISLANAVVPDGFGYCVTDAKGKAIFHSDEVKSLEEHFLEECEFDDELRAAILSRTNDLVNTSYLGRSHRLYVTPLEDIPWTLVVFRDKEMLRTTNLEILILSLELYLVILLSLILICVLSYFLGRNGSRHWFWPSRSRSDEYVGSAIGTFAIGLVLIALIIWASGLPLMIAAIVLPAFAIMLLHSPDSRLHRVLDSFGRKLVKGRTSYRTNYISSSVFLLLLVCALPTLACFKTVRDFEMELLVRHGQMSLARGLRDRQARVWKQINELNVPDKRTMVRERLERTDDVYFSFFFDTVQKTASASPQPERHQELEPLRSVLAQLSPLIDRLTVEKYGLLNPSSEDGSWWSGGTLYHPGRLELARSGMALPGQFKWTPIPPGAARRWQRARTAIQPPPAEL